MPSVKNLGVWPNTDLDLNTSAALPEGSRTPGMWPDTLSSATKSAVNGDGFQTDVPNENMGPRGEGRAPDETDPRGYPVSGFVRPEAYRTESFVPV
jgi:hypothetical protein